ncbi:hypothetical protein BD311DRAFT_764367 [Dichomitus squalens]|uniref:Zn(2)-C6 fungal-type domain-containing protein n=1 Tax=Dichomitus squalens TaxID=114155 RepID=A0A4Q9MG00_9APHY|nr:hypothetical protein BD311DRAFT_764367 [Dichomitus squalens]
MRIQTALPLRWVVMSPISRPFSSTSMSAAPMLDEPLAWLDSFMQGSSADDSLNNHSSNVLSIGSSTPSEGQHSPNFVAPSRDPPSSASSTPAASASRHRPQIKSASSSTPTSDPAPPRKRIRPKIALDPHQPPTARGNPRARVYVACNQCRVRKTRCDGAKPVCFNCHKRPPDVGECSYDARPNRRGRDKAPGTRARMATSHRFKRRKTSSGTVDSDSDSNSSNPTHESGSASGGQTATHLHASYDNFPGLSSEEESEEYDPFPLVDLDNPIAGTEFSLGRYAQEVEQNIPRRPSLQFTRETWWDALLTFYSTDSGTTDTISLVPEQRSATVLRVVSDFRALFHASIYWVSFIHIPRFFDALLNPTTRGSMQPSLVMSALAIGLFSQSSEAEKGAAGRAKALQLIEIAHSSLQASMASGWVNVELIQAAWLIVYFELQSHPMRSTTRHRSSLLLLDSLIRLFSLTTLDADIKRAHTSNRPSVALLNAAGLTSSISEVPSNNNIPFYTSAHTPGFFAQPSGVFPLQQGVNFNLPPHAPPAHLVQPIVPDNMTLGPSTTLHPVDCNCASLTLKAHWPGVSGIAPAWAGTLIWPENISEGEFRKEECRRLVWASVMVTASLNAYNSAHNIEADIDKQKLWMKNPDNYALLFPGESLAMHGAPVQPNNVWTLYLRSMLLLHSCVQKRADLTLSDAERAQFAMQAWLEMDAIDDALGQHTCELERNFGHQAREMLFSSRMCVSHEFHRYIPRITTKGSQLFYRDKAEAWLRLRMATAEQVWKSLTEGVPSPALDYRRPLLIYWFMSHVLKALVLWEADPTLIVALEAAKVFSKRTEYLMLFWPSEDQRKEWASIRMKLVKACLEVGISPPTVALPGPIPHMFRQARQAQSNPIQ